MTNVKLEKSTILSIGGTRYIFIQIFRAPAMYSFRVGGGIRLVDNGVHETHVAKWNSRFLQEQWTYLSKRHAALFWGHAYFFPVYETTHTSMPQARSPERHRSELEEVTHRAAKSLRFHSETIKSSAGSIHSKPRFLDGGWTNPFETYRSQLGSSSPNTGEDVKTNIWNHHPANMWGFHKKLVLAD